MRLRSFLSIFLAVALGGLVARAPIPVVHGETGSFSVLDAAKGGTGQSSYTAGDVLVATGATTLTKLTKGSDGTFLGVSSGTVGYYTPAGGSSLTLFYGDGSSGSATMDGSTVCFGLTPSGNVYTALANIYATSLTINSGVTLKMQNYVLFCSVSLTNNGTISCNGNNASGATAGVAITTAAFNSSGSGQAGIATALTATTGVNGSGGCIGGAGGGGGLSDGTQAASGTASIPSAMTLALIRSGQVLLMSSTTPSSMTLTNTGAQNGGRGSGDGTNTGGGSGGWGGILYVAAKSITTGASGTYEAKGGNGGNGAAGTAGGGGGGGGGGVVIYYDTASGTALSGSNVLATGGNGGNGSTTAGSGRNGVAGSTFIIQRQ